jgi:hypothetical protein
MSRKTLGDRLSDLTTNPNLTPSQREFAASLLNSYSQRNRLSKGRRVWVDKLEEIAANPTVVPSDSPLLVRIDDVLPRTEAASWDQGFLESIRQQVVRGHNLSSRQMEHLDKIEVRNTPEAVKSREDWANTYRTEHHQTAMIAAEYYVKTGYYLDMARSIINDPDYVPPMDSYTKMTENKFAKKVISEWKREPKYKVGSSVIARTGRRSANRDLHRGGIVLDTNGPIISAAKGSKRYKVLPYGKAEPVYCEERDIKILKISS